MPIPYHDTDELNDLGIGISQNSTCAECIRVSGSSMPDQCAR